MRWDTTLVLIMIVHHAPVKVYSLRVESSAIFPNSQSVKILILYPLAVCIMAASASATHATRWSSCSEERLKGI